MKTIWLKYKAMSVQAKSAIWFALGSILQKGISFITVPIFVRLLTTEEYGTYSLYLSWLQLLTIITSLYLYHGVFNNGMTKFSEDRDVYISSMQGLTLAITAGVFCVYLVAFRFWSDLLRLAPIFIFMMFIEMTVTPALHFWLGRQRFEFRYQRLVAVTIAKSIANPVLGLFMVLLSQEKDVARVASVVIVEVLFGGTIMIVQYIRGRKVVHTKYWKYALTLAIPLMPHYLSGMILNQGDRVMIDRMIGTSEVAYYSVAYNIGMLVQIITSAISHSFTPWLYLKIKANNLINVKKTVNILLLIVGVVSLGLMVCSPELVLIFGSEKYASAVYVIPPVAASVFFIFLYNILAIPQFYFEKTGFLAISSIAAAVLNILLNYVFISMFGFVAAGYTTLACYVLYSLGHYVVSQKVLKKNMDGKSLFDKPFILVLSTIMIIIGVCCNFLFDFWYIRYSIAFVIVIVAYVKRKDLIALIQNIKTKKDDKNEA